VRHWCPALNLFSCFHIEVIFHDVTVFFLMLWLILNILQMGNTHGLACYLLTDELW
jgi:hypothetical protein